MSTGLPRTCEKCEIGAEVYECSCDSGWSGAHCESKDVQYEKTKVSGEAYNTSASNLQTMCITAEMGDLLKIGRDTYSGIGNYAVILGNLDLVVDGIDSMSTTIDCDGKGRAFFIDGSTRAGSALLVLRALTIKRCRAQPTPGGHDEDDWRAPMGGAIFITDAAVTLQNVFMTGNSAVELGGAIYGRFSVVRLEDTVLYRNTAAEGAGITLQESVMTTKRSFIHMNMATNADVLQQDVSCKGGAVITDIRAGKHWRRLGFDLIELDTCSCCSGCNQAAPPLIVDQVTLLDGPRPMLALQGSFLTFGEGSASTLVYAGGLPCVAGYRNVTSYRIYCYPSKTLMPGDSISVNRNDGATALAAFASASGNETQQKETVDMISEITFMNVLGLNLTNQTDLDAAVESIKAEFEQKLFVGLDGYNRSTSPRSLPPLSEVVVQITGHARRLSAMEGSVGGYGRRLESGGPTGRVAVSVAEQHHDLVYNRLASLVRFGGSTLALPGYSAGLNFSIVDLSVTDAFRAYNGSGLVVRAEELVTSENGHSATISIKLKSQPQSTVTVPVTVVYHRSAEGIEGGIPSDFLPASSVTSLVSFNVDFWEGWQKVVLFGESDRKDAGPHSYSVILGPSESPDPNYCDKAGCYNAQGEPPHHTRAPHHSLPRLAILSWVSLIWPLTDPVSSTMPLWWGTSKTSMVSLRTGGTFLMLWLHRLTWDCRSCRLVRLHTERRGSGPV